MGLLDSFTGSLSSPDGQMTPAAQGLLAAGLGILAHNRGLTSGTQALGMGGLEGINAYAGARQAQAQQALQNAQLQHLAIANRNAQAIYDTLNGGSAPGNPQYASAQQPSAAAPAQVPAMPGGGIMPAVLGGANMGIGGAADGTSQSGAPATAQSAAPVLNGPRIDSQFPLDFQQVVKLKALGGPDLMDAYKFAHTPVTLGAGQWVQDPVTGQRQYINDPKTGINYDASTGSSSAIPGYAGANAAIEGAKADATAAATNRYNFQPVALPGGRIGLVSNTDLANGRGPAGAGGNGAPIVTKDPAAETFATKNAENASTYGQNLDARVQEGAEQMHNLDAQLALAQQFKMGAGNETRLQAAKLAQAAGVPQSVVDKIAGGDMGAMQAFAKVTVNQTLSALRQSLGNNRMAQAEYKSFAAANPNIDSDPNALEKVATFYRQVHARNVAEQQSRNDYIDNGGDPTKWGTVWAQHQLNSGEVKTTPVAGVVMGAKGAPQKQSQPQRAVTRTGTLNGRRVVQYSDGTVAYQ